MPKTRGSLWGQVTAWENLLAAYRLARRGKRYRCEVLRFTREMEEQLLTIQSELLRDAWRPTPPREFMVRDPKPRLIQAPVFRDRVVHHALHRVAEPLFERKFIHDTYGCRAGKGTHAAAGRVQQLLRRMQRRGPVYALKADISRYFPSVHQGRLMELLGRTIRDRDTLRLCRRILHGGGDAGIGLPVGALPSQLWANVYLDRFDHHVKDDLGVKHYVRYMDDWIILDHSKARLWERLNQAAHFLATDLGLALNPKTAVFPSSQGVDFCGYRVWASHKLLRRRSIRRMRERIKILQAKYRRGEIDLEQVRSHIASWVGHAQHADSYRTREGLLREARFRRNPEPPTKRKE